MTDAWGLETAEEEEKEEEARDEARAAASHNAEAAMQAGAERNEHGTKCHAVHIILPTRTL